MQRVLRKRILRDLKANFLRYLALGLMIVMAMFLVVTIVGSGENLTRGTESLAKEGNLEDGEFSVFVPLTDDELDDIKAMDIDIEEQFYFDNVIENEDKSTVRIFKLRKDINKLHYIEGSKPKAINEIVMEKRFAEVHKLKINDNFNISGISYKISGICCVSDYDAPYKEISDTSCNSKYFGMVFLTDEAYQEFKESNKAQKSEEFSYAYKLNKKATNEELKAYLK
ncbi:MAG: ABC transporter permease, partial [Lachnospiraceae bacterium]|nr:ABC transporter permease [Lachnospiraceae bacterium]